MVVYALCEPDTGEIRYIGCTKCPRRRRAEQFSCPKWPVSPWVRHLRANGLVPEFRVLAEAIDDGWVPGLSLEDQVIAQYASPRLLNKFRNPHFSEELVRAQ